MRNVVLMCVGVAALAAVLSAQGSAPPDGTMRELVTEIRSLRADLNRVAGNSIRSQLLVGRLQLQEDRILTLSQQIADFQKQIDQAVQVRIAMETDLKHMEETHDVSADERQAVEGRIKQLRPQVAQHQAREQRLRQQESYFSTLLAEEQARWTDFSSRLDELERALITPRR